MQIVRATAADLDEMVDAFIRLLPQLSPGSQVRRADLAAMVDSPTTYLLLARDPAIVGSLTLSLVLLPGGLNGVINAVVVDGEARGRGIGEALVREAIGIARAAGAYRLSLTSRNTRASAHRLYRRVGFDVLESSVFRMTL